MMCELRERDRIAQHGGHDIFQRAVDERTETLAASDIVNQQADLEAVADFTYALEHVIASDIQRQGAHLDSDLFADPARSLGERGRFAGDHDDVDAGSAKLAREMIADSLGSPHDQRPRAVTLLQIQAITPLPEARNSPGVIPVARRKAKQKAEEDVNPKEEAIVLML